MKLTKNDLPNIGFEQIGAWKINGKGIGYSINQHKQGFLGIGNALYAFTSGNDVMYIGKTTKSITGRFVGYFNGNGRATNNKLHVAILDLLRTGNTVEIWVFAPTIPFQILGFEVNLAAGLEDSLISEFKPEWNGKRVTVANNQNNAQLGIPVCDFKIKLGKIYYNSGFINPGVTASQELDVDGEPVKVFLGSSANFVNSAINRRANTNGTVRIIGNNRQIAEWFQDKFNPGDEVSAAVIDRQTILLREPTPNAQQVV